MFIFIDYLAVDIIFGGFEGLGLIIQKERFLYWNTTDEEEIDGIGKRQVLPHEMAHMVRKIILIMCSGTDMFV